MKNVVIAFALVLSLGLPAWAQTASPAPVATPDPHIYDDRAMHFVVPTSYVLLGRRTVKLAELGSKLAPLAEWAKRDQGSVITITLMAEADTEALHPWLVTFKNEIREKIDGVFVKSTTLSAMKNGMPAYWLDLTYGSGFNSRKLYGWVWSDGQRGLFLSISFPIDTMSDQDAKKALSDVRATLYPNFPD